MENHSLWVYLSECLKHRRNAKEKHLRIIGARCFRQFSCFPTPPICFVAVNERFLVMILMLLVLTPLASLFPLTHFFLQQQYTSRSNLTFTAFLCVYKNFPSSSFDYYNQCLISDFDKGSTFDTILLFFFHKLEIYF